MKYPDGQLAKVGDQLECWIGCKGVVVASMDTNEFSKEHPAEQWAYLGKGIMVLTDQVGLVHYLEPDEDMVLLARDAV